MTDLTSGNDAYIADGGEIVNALEGNDQITIIHVDDSAGVGNIDFDYFAPAEVYGNQGDDWIVSQSWGDKLYGDSGNDTLYGGGGDDLIKGGSGNDTIHTGASLNDDDIDYGDVVWAGTGNDTVYLEFAHNGDVLRGEGGIDTLKLFNSGNHITQFSLVAGGSNAGLVAEGFEILEYYGGSGAEVVEGGTRGDTISTGEGGDIVSGLAGDDIIRAGGGADIATGGDGDDSVFGGDGDDVLSGLTGDDFLNGDAGNDAIRDGDGDDTVLGGGGNDTFRTGRGTDSVHGGDGDDTIVEEDADSFSILVLGHPITYTGGDTLTGDAGNDTIRAGTGDDTIDGGTGSDVINGGAGLDQMTGGTGFDVFDFDAVTDSGLGDMRDVITDFTVSTAGSFTVIDRIDVSGIDARAGLAGDQAFTFIGTAGFSGEGQIRLVQQGANVSVVFNTEGNGGAEMAILLVNADASQISVIDFIL